MKKSMHRRRRRPASASTTNETLDRVSGIIARRKKDAAAAAAPRRGPLFNSDAFSSHNARVQAWQPRFQSPSGSRSALRDIRKRKQALLEAATATATATRTGTGGWGGAATAVVSTSVAGGPIPARFSGATCTV